MPLGGACCNDLMVGPPLSWLVQFVRRGSIHPRDTLGIIVFSCQAPCQASFRPLLLGLKSCWGQLQAETACSVLFDACLSQSLISDSKAPGLCNLVAYTILQYITTNNHDHTLQWPFQEPKLEVPDIYKAYIRPMRPM